MRKTFNTTEEITEAFIKDGWNNISFTQTTENGKTLFVMNQTGNIFDNHGDIYRYNVKCCLIVCDSDGNRYTNERGERL